MFIEALLGGSYWCWNLQSAETSLKRSSVMLCRACTMLSDQGAKCKEIWICQNLQRDLMSHSLAYKERTKCLELTPAVGHNGRFRLCLSVYFLSDSETSVWNDSCKNQLIWKAVGGLCSLPPYVHCLAWVLASLRLYNKGGECKVGTTHRAMTATFMENIAGWNKVELYFSV